MREEKIGTSYNIKTTGKFTLLFTSENISEFLRRHKDCFENII